MDGAGIAPVVTRMVVPIVYRGTIPNAMYRPVTGVFGLHIDTWKSTTVGSVRAYSLS